MGVCARVAGVMELEMWGIRPRCGRYGIGDGECDLTPGLSATPLRYPCFGKHRQLILE